MDLLVKILIGIATVVAVLLFVALFVKRAYVIERAITIDRPKQEVFDYIKLVRNQENYSKWVMADPSMKKHFRGADGTVGFVYAWDSENDKVGKGEQEIKAISEGERLDAELRFLKPFESIATASMVTEAVSATATKVTWRMQGVSRYPFNLMNVFMDKMLGDDMETSLKNLEQLLEQPQLSAK